MLGNPPWEKVKLSEKEFFASRAPEIANLAGAKRKAAIEKLQANDPALWSEYRFSLRRSRRREPLHPQLWPLPAMRTGRREHLRHLRRGDA